MKQNLDAIAILALIMQVLAIQAANLPPLSQLATSYEAERTTSGVMFDLEAKKDLVIYGIDINTIYNSPARLEMWIKEGSYKGFEKDANAWTNIFNSTVNGNGMGVPTPIPTGFFGPIVLKANETRSLYIAYPQGANLRYLTGTEEGLPAASNDDLVIYEGIARRVGFDSAIYSPRVYSGALNYMVGSPPTAAPTAVPTQKPTTAGPTHAPTIRPTALPTTVESRFNTFATSFDSSTTSAGTMFDIKTKDRDIMIHTLGFNTYKKTDISIEVWTREGTYSSFEKDISGWTKLVNMTLEGQGLDVPTILPYGSFDPIAIRRDTRQAFYIRTTGPFIRYSDGVAEGQVVSSNEDIILFEGAGKRKEITGATMSPRVWNGVIKYETIVMPTPAPVTNAPTRDLNGLELATTTYYPIHDTYIQKGVTASQSGKVQLLVDGAPKRVSLFHFDISNINGANAITKAVFRVYALTDSLKGGDFSVIQDGYIDDSSNWDNVIYGDFEGFKVGSLGPVTAKTYYEIDITDAFMDRIPTTFILRVGSDNADGVMYRSSASAVNNGPMLTIEFATPPNSSVMHEVFGTESPTSAPTSERVWPDLRTPSNPPSRYFNYNPNSRYGPDNWGRISHDRFWSQYEGLDSDLSDNRCSRGKRQSPRNLCRTSDECLEFHQPRPRRGEYGFIGSSTPKPTPYIFHNKLRASYKERKDEEEKPEPPGVDFARNGSTGPDVQDLVNLDIKIKSEHRLCNKQYDAEMQLYFLHYKGNLEAMAILIEADGPRNDHFQQLIDFFQEKYDDDKRQCERRKRRARALLSSDSASNDNLLSSKLFRGSSGEFEKTQVDAKEGDTFYRRLQGKFLSLVTRQTARTWRWDPLMPGDIWKSIHYWSYSGSTTEPPCFEGVRWRVIDVPMKISPGQYEQLKKIQFGHVDPDTCRRTSTHYDQSNARPVQSYRGGAYYRCRRSDYVSDKERAASGKRRGFNDKKDWRGVGLLPWVEGEFPNV